MATGKPGGVEVIREPGTGHPRLRRRVRRPTPGASASCAGRSPRSPRRRGATPEEVDAVSLAVSEVLTNVVVHAYAPDGGPGVLDVRATARDGRLEVVVADEGRGFAPRDDGPGLGLGLVLGARMADALRIDAEPPARHARQLRFDLADGQ